MSSKGLAQDTATTEKTQLVWKNLNEDSNSLFGGKVLVLDRVNGLLGIIILGSSGSNTIIKLFSTGFIFVFKRIVVQLDV